MPFAEILSRVERGLMAIEPARAVIVGVDGADASGKTRFARELYHGLAGRRPSWSTWTTSTTGEG